MSLRDYATHKSECATQPVTVNTPGEYKIAVNFGAVCTCGLQAALDADGLWRDFNLNNYVRVRIKPKGFKILEDSDMEINKFVSSRGGTLDVDRAGRLRKKQDADGYVEYQLWSLMQDFGPHISIGCDPPFETTIQFPPPPQTGRP